MPDLSGVGARRLRVHGRVQGVFFRDSTRRQAQRRSLGGWARNCPDGTLEVWLEGAPDAVAEVEGWIRSGGPASARVAAVDAHDVPPAGHRTFEIRG